MDLRRNRLDGWLTRLQPAPTLDKYEEKDHSRRRRSACAAAVSARLIRWSKNIFNGLLRVPVKTKIPALNSI
jgi:hypothetical protein